MPPASQPLPSISDAGLEARVKTRLEQCGYTVRSTPESQRMGVNLVATKMDELGFETTLFASCKNETSPLGVEFLQELGELLSQSARGVRGLVVCPAGFTEDAILFAKKHHILLWTTVELAEN